jgi:hypothetical protein
MGHSEACEDSGAGVEFSDWIAVKGIRDSAVSRSGVFLLAENLRDFHILRGVQADWAEQAGVNERRVFGEVVSGGETKSAFRGAGFLFHKPIREPLQIPALIGEVVPGQPLAIRRLLLVANEPVGPDIGDLDFEFVAGGFQKALRNFHAPWRGPDHPEVAAVEANPGDVIYSAEVEEEI